MSDTPIHRAFNGKWKWVEAVQPILVLLLSIIQGLVIYIYTTHTKDLDSHLHDYKLKSEIVENRLDGLEIFRAETNANRFTSQDALRMNSTLLEAISKLETELKRCIRTQDC